MGPRTRTHTLCEPAQSKYMSTGHKRHQKSHFIQKFTGKMLRPRLGPERGHALCASLRSRNACPLVTRVIRRATFYRNLQEKCRGPDWAQNADAHFVRACAVHKSHFIRKFIGKLPRPRVTTLIKLRPLLRP